MPVWLDLSLNVGTGWGGEFRLEPKMLQWYYFSVATFLKPKILGKTEFVWGMTELLHSSITDIATGQSTLMKTRRELCTLGVEFYCMQINLYKPDFQNVGL